MQNAPSTARRGWGVWITLPDWSGLAPLPYPVIPMRRRGHSVSTDLAVALVEAPRDEVTPHETRGTKRYPRRHPRTSFRGGRQCTNTPRGVSIVLTLPGHVDEGAVNHFRPLAQRLDAHTLVVPMHPREVLGVDGIGINPIHRDTARSPRSRVGAGLEEVR